MKYLKSFSVLFLWIASFIVFIFIFLSGAYSKKYKHTVLAPPEILKQVPVGELIAGFHLEQPINWNWFKDSRLNASDTLCINLLLANFNDRDNTGIFSVSLQAEHFSQKILLNAHQVHDNVYQPFCFDALPLQNIADKPIKLVFEGINSLPGKAITAWMTSDTARGEARLNNQELNQALIFSIDAVTTSNKKLTQVIVLTLLCGLSISILFWPTKLKLH
ncbi:hypothetical protein BCF11_3147 [Collimonas sp. PA-H2]|uniref:hypothetical protein n=1 Tax=Collimonas sp. PA-H2 TaxID=1881062 RepID=UPI000BF48492|nr:hypothetical protein [Collimonas sp. PA-H2]PFH10718.1 hypothetical protein BCF11_3147 [Collimonas sp. PA-H2]